MLRLMPVTLRRGTDNAAVPGLMAECGRCGGREFTIFKVQEQGVPHYQCIECGVSYCGTWDGKQCTDHAPPSET